MDNNILRGGSNLLTLVFFLIQEIFRVIFTANVSFKSRISQNTILMKFYYLSIYLFIYLLIILFFCRSNEQLKGKLRHECSTEVTTEECILYFLHHKNDRLALESTRKPKVCPDKCHLGRTLSKLSPRTFYRPDLLPLGLRGWASRERGYLSFS